MAVNNGSSLSQATIDQEKERNPDPNGKKIVTSSKKQSENLCQRPNLSKCFGCGQIDHHSNSWPKRKILSILDDDGDSKNEQEEGFDQEEESLELDDGRGSLVYSKGF